MHYHDEVHQCTGALTLQVIWIQRIKADEVTDFLYEAMPPAIYF